MPVSLKKRDKRNKGKTIKGIWSLGEKRKMVNIKKLPSPHEKRKHYEMNTRRMISMDEDNPDIIREGLATNKIYWVCTGCVNDDF